MLQFTPKNEDDLYPLIADNSICQFDVYAADDKPSKTGLPMITLFLNVYNATGEKFELKDYLIANDAMLFKVKHFCESVGLEERYCLGKLEARDCVGMKGKAKIAIKKDKTGQYRPKNEIKDYMPNLGIEADASLNDDIPM